MFESIVNDYLQSTPYKEWLIIVILQYTASKSELSRDTIDILKTDSYSVLWNDVKHFIDEVQLKNERKEFNIAVCQNVTSANTLQTLKEHCVAKIEIEDIRNVDVNEVTVSTENECERRGDKHDGILYMNICGVKVGVGFIKVVGNAFATITSDKNDDLEKLLKGTSHSHQSDENTSKLQSFAVLVYGCEFHFLSMHLIGDMYVVDEYDAFVIPDSGLNLLHIGDIVKIVKKFKIQMIKYYHKLIQKPCIVTRPLMSGLPTASPSKP
ncbi:16186_t:CDS:2, partial [Entrophospora sp. SA101]